jgi:hypothetical protein
MYSDVMLLLARTSPEPPREQARDTLEPVPPTASGCGL